MSKTVLRLIALFLALIALAQTTHAIATARKVNVEFDRDPPGGG